MHDCLLISPNFRVCLAIEYLIEDYCKVKNEGDVKKWEINCGGTAAAPLSKWQRVNFGAAGEDRISYLPRELINRILMRLPIHDMARTSILSKAWRNVWAMHPNLVLNSRFHTRLASKNETNTHEYEFTKVLNMILSSHTGPILHFCLYITPVLRHCSINRCIEQLSDKGLRSIYLFFAQKEVYSLPSAMFGCPDLTLLTLYNWVVAGPSNIEAGSFANLTKVELKKTSIALDITFGTQLQVLQLRSCTGIEHLTTQFRSGNNLRWGWFQSTRKLKYLGNCSRSCFDFLKLFIEMI